MKISKYSRSVKSPKAKQAKLRRRTALKKKRPLHKKFFLHPITVFLLLCVGVLLLGITIPATANNILVTAKVSAPFLTDPAVIESINSNSSTLTAEQIAAAIDAAHAIVVKTNNITFGGTCPKVSYVSAYRNNTFAGSTMCVGDPIFSINVGLVPGLNVIKLQDYNFTDDPGPLSQLIYVYYDNTVPASNVVKTVPEVGVPKTSSPNPLLVTSGTQAKIVRVGNTLTWEIKIVGGTAPYTLFIDFGDHTSTTITSNKSGNVTFSHIYKRPGGDNYNYAIKIRIRDSNGIESFLQLMAIVRPTSTIVTNIANQSDTSGWLPASLRHWLWLAWPTYGIFLLMVISFWLGEQQERWIFSKPRRRLKHHGSK